MLRSANLTFVLAVLLAGAFSCETAEEVEGILGDENNSANVVGVFQSSATPGTTARVQADKAVFSEEDSSARVEIGGIAAKILNILDRKTVQVIVPIIEPGEAAVTIIEPGKNPGEPGALNVLPPRALRLLLAFSEGQVDLRSAQPSAGAARRSTDEGGRRIQFEVFNILGRLVFRGIVNHPTEGRHEVFDHDEEDGHTMFLLPAVHAEELFHLRIPNVPGGATIRFYGVPEGVDVNTVEGRRLRKFLNEIHTEG